MDEPKINIYVKRRMRKQRDGTQKRDREYTAIFRSGTHEFSRGTGQTSRAKALEWASSRRQEIIDRELPKRLGETVTIDNLFALWWTDHASKMRSSQTMAERASVLRSLIGPDVLVLDLTEDVVGDLVTDLFEGPKGDRAPATVNRYIDVLRSALRVGRKRWKTRRNQFNHIEWSDFRQREPKERVIFLSPEEIGDILKFLSKRAPHIAEAVAWSIYTGCRLNETATLTWDRIDLKAQYCEVFAKGGDYRTVLLSNVAARVLKSLPQRDFVFDLTNRRKHWEAAREAIGRPEMRFHDLRHLNATLLGQYGSATLSTIGRQLGHADTSTTERYRHVADLELQQALDAVPDFTGEMFR